jgi:hypothetical protein
MGLFSPATVKVRGGLGTGMHFLVSHRLSPAGDDRGEQTARRMLADAGFNEVEVLDVPDDPMGSMYVATKTVS